MTKDKSNILAFVFIGFILICLVLLAGISDTDFSISLELTNALIAVSGLAVAAITVVVSYLVRTDQQRQALYDAQLSLYPKLFATQLLLLKTRSVLLNNFSKSHNDQINLLILRFENQFEEMWLIMPAEHLILGAAVLSKYKEITLAWQQQMHTDQVARLFSEFVKVNSASMNSMRKSLGVEMLHDETMQLLE